MHLGVVVLRGACILTLQAWTLMCGGVDASPGVVWVSEQPGANRASVTYSNLVDPLVIHLPIKSRSTSWVVILAFFLPCLNL